MSALTNIKIEHVFQALDEMDGHEVHESKENAVYQLLFNKKSYSVRSVTSIANKYANGSEIDLSEFSDEEELSNYLINYNFTIVKTDFYQNAISQLRNLLSILRNNDEIKEMISARKEVYAKYQPIFSLNKISELSEDDFKSFLDFKNNRHWTGLDRHKESLTEDMGKLRNALNILLDESKPILERYNTIRSKNNGNLVNGLAKALMTAILHIEYPEKYGIWNQTSEKGLEKIDLLPKLKRGATEGEKYSVLNEIFLALSQDLNLDLWSLDALWWKSDFMNQTYLTKENVLEAISISKLIVDQNLVGKRLSQKEDELVNKDKYNSYIKPEIDKFKSNNNGNTPNQLLKLSLEKFVNLKGYSDKLEVEGFHYYGQVVNPYVWAAITKKDSSIQNGKTSYYPQLYVLVNNLCILFGFCYGHYVENTKNCVQFIKDGEELKQQLIELSKTSEEIRIFASFDPSNENDNHEMKLSSSEDIEKNWTNNIKLIHWSSVKDSSSPPLLF